MNMSTMGSGGSSPTKHSVRACSTGTMKRTTGNPTTTTPTNLWCRSLVLCATCCRHENVFDITFDPSQAEATSQGSHEYYDDVVDLLNARKEASSSNGGVTVGVYHVEVGIKASRENEFFRNITQYSSQVSWLIHSLISCATS